MRQNATPANALRNAYRAVVSGFSRTGEWQSARERRTTVSETNEASRDAAYPGVRHAPTGPARERRGCGGAKKATKATKTPEPGRRAGARRVRRGESRVSDAFESVRR